MENNTQKNIPSVKNIEDLNKLTNEFKPVDVKFLLSLKSQSSMEECIDNAQSTINRLQKFVENGHSTDGLNFKYKQITRI